MARTLPSLSCTLVLCAALGACSDSPTTSPRKGSPNALVEAANRNVGDGARVFGVTRDDERSKTVEKHGPASTNPQQYIDNTVDYHCPGYVAAAGDGSTLQAIPYCGGDPYIPPEEPYYPPQPQPQPAVYANFTFGSDASAISNIVANGISLKTLTLSSFSQAIQNVSFTTLDASFRNVGGQTTCYATAGQFDSSHASGSGSPLYFSTSRNPAWQGVIKWEVVGTHSFTPVSGAGGGGTFYSSDSTCG